MVGEAAAGIAAAPTRIAAMIQRDLDILVFIAMTITMNAEQVLCQGRIPLTSNARLRMQLSNCKICFQKGPQSLVNSPSGDASGLVGA